MDDETGIVDVVAKAVRRARKSLGLSQEDLALEAGLDRTYVSQVERGTRNCTIVVLTRLAKALNTTPDLLLCLRGRGGAGLNLVRCQVDHFEHRPRESRGRHWEPDRIAQDRSRSKADFRSHSHNVSM
ncbi:helix-turn-helix domain-containing protein [Bradyrhizobium huanghuaihaiense]|uniref:helix-turn-helix domain-containing protein n=1 Tax=Bradyrhizobium huanghuaihaiense TaxID=990078 RepID=UPI0011A6BB75